MQDYTAYMVTDVLRDVVKPGSGGTYPTAYVSGVDVAGKTGTQNFDESVLQNMTSQLMQTEIAGLLDIRHNTQWLFHRLRKRWSKIMLAIAPLELHSKCSK